MKAFPLFVLLLLLTGCAAIVLVEPNRTSIGEAFSVEPQIAWSRFQGTGGPVEVWTAEGTALQALHFFPGIEDGATLYAQADVDLPAFKRTMTPPEIVELLESSLSKLENGTATARGLRPGKFGSADGFRFEMLVIGKDEVERDASVVGTIKDGRLYMMMLIGARIHYFPKYVPYFEKMVQSVQMT